MQSGSELIQDVLDGSVGSQDEVVIRGNLVQRIPHIGLADDDVRAGAGDTGRQIAGSSSAS
jgi:hypothetical protein